MKTFLIKPMRIALVAVTLLGAAMPSLAHADWDHDNGRGHHDEWRDHDDWRGHEFHARYWHRHHPHYEPGVVYAPPAVVEPPPPVGINLIVPLHIH